MTEIAAQNHTIRYLFPISCKYPAEVSERKQVPLIDVSVYSFKSDHSNPWHFPRPVELGQYMYVEARTRLSWLQDHEKELQGYPVTCWLSSDQYNTKPNNAFLLNGCPVGKTPESTASLLFYKKKLPVRVALKLSPMFWPKGANQTFVHCQILPCLRDSLSGIYGYTLCPLSNHCNPNSPHIPWDFKSPSIQLVTVGPLRLSKLSARKPPVVASNRCTKVCESSKPKLPAPQRIIYDGVSIYTILLVAFVSFLVGVLLTAILWTLHNRKQPTLQKRRQTVEVVSGEVPLMLDRSAF
jgi:hypothetical protein